MCVSGYDFHKILSHQDGTLVLICVQTQQNYCKAWRKEQGRDGEEFGKCTPVAFCFCHTYVSLEPRS